MKNLLLGPPLATARLVHERLRKLVVLAVFSSDAISSTAEQLFFYLFQAATLAILILAANTSFADFPRLASFAAGDAFLPRWFTKRGHRLVFSTGILTLSVAAAAVVVAFDANYNRMLPL